MTISVEIELGWGFHDIKDPRDVPELSGDGSVEREALGWFLSLCDEFEVPVTFDVVGHLLLDSCEGDHGGPHPEGWFQRDPGTDAETDPLFYFPEVVGEIRGADVDHEICTHTFSHVLCDEVGADVLDWELDRVEEIHDEDVVSIVTPRHREPPRDLLLDHGIEVIRMPVEEEAPSGPVGRYIWTLTRKHPLHEPEEMGGLIETRTASLMSLTATYLSSGVSSPHPAYRAIPRGVRQRIHERFLKSGLRDCVTEDSHVHYWTHLYNLANEAQKRPLVNFVEELSESDAEPLRMADLLDKRQ